MEKRMTRKEFDEKEVGKLYTLKSGAEATLTDKYETSLFYCFMFDNFDFLCIDKAECKRPIWKVQSGNDMIVGWY